MAYRSSRDIEELDRFLAECTVRSARGQVAAGELYEAFLVWSRRKGMWDRSMTAFGRVLASRGFQRRKSNTVIWLGLALKKAGV